MSLAWGELTADKILEPIKAVRISGKGRTPLKGISTDSRKICRGELFLALVGEKFDGHDFALRAIRKGAAGLVVEQNQWERITREGTISPKDYQDRVVIIVGDTLKALGDMAAWWRHEHKVNVVAITGSAGKTTTKEMTAGILEHKTRTLKNQGNMNNLIGLPLSLLKLKREHENAVLEMGMNRPGEIGRLTDIANPDLGLITNVGAAHLEGVGDIRGVARAKAELVQHISPRAKVLVNGDDNLLMETVTPLRKDLMTFGLGEANRVRAENIKDHDRQGLSFRIAYEDISFPVRLRAQGLHNVMDAVAAAAIGLCLNRSADDIIKGLWDFQGLKGRFTVMTLPGGVVLVDDTYNANPSSLRAALASLGSFVGKEGRIIVGLGEMMELGDAAAEAHREAGRMIAGLRVRYFVATGQHAHEMIAGAVESGLPDNRTEIVETQGEMLASIKKRVQKGDLIFLKGSRKMALERVVEGLAGEKPGKER